MFDVILELIFPLRRCYIMDIDNIGTILRDRIKEMGMTQEEFALKTGIGLSSLKKYMSGKVFYSIDTLELMAEALDCSYDFLLGKSKTPKPELHEAKEITRLHDNAIAILQRYANQYDTNANSKKYLDTLSTLIEMNFLIDRIQNYLFIESNEQLIYEKDEPLPQPGIHIGTSYLSVPDIEDAYLLGIVRALADAKQQIKEKEKRKSLTSETTRYLDE